MKENDSPPPQSVRPAGVATSRSASKQSGRLSAKASAQSTRQPPGLATHETEGCS